MSPSGASSTCSLIACSRRPQNGQVYVAGLRDCARRSCHQRGSGSEALTFRHDRDVIPGRRRLIVTATRHLARELAAVRPGTIEALPRARPRRGDRILGAVVHVGFYLAIAAAVVAFFSAAIGHGTWQGELRVAAGAALVLEGVLLASNWHGARRLLLGRLHARSTARNGPPASVVDVLRWRLFGPLLALVALAALCGGVVLVALGAQDLV